MEFPLPMRKLRLIWDFRGPDAYKIAEHHEIHLRDYIKSKNTDLNITGVEKLNDTHSLAFMIVNDSEMKSVRDDLKPHRGQLYEQRT